MTPDERERYSRQIRFTPMGEAGQRRLLDSHVAIVGCGALGTVQASCMVRAGVGRITLIDRDYVELSNLQRQHLFTESDAAEGMPKAVAAARALREANSTVQLEPVVADVDSETIHDLLNGAGLILDGTDNFETRYLINDYAVREAKPWIYGAAVGSYGVVLPVLPGRTACLACVYPEPPSGAQPTCETAGVLNAITGAVASLQCGAALRILSGAASGFAPRLTTVDAWTGVIRQTAAPVRDPECAACVLRRFEYLEHRRRAPISLCGRNAVQIHERSRPLDLGSLRRTLEGLGNVRANEFALRFFVPPYEMTIFPDGRAIIKGTTDTGVARGLYARYVGT